MFYDSANQFHPSQQVVMHLSVRRSLLYQGKQQFGSSKVTSGEKVQEQKQITSDVISASQNGLFFFRAASSEA